MKDKVGPSAIGIYTVQTWEMYSRKGRLVLLNCTIRGGKRQTNRETSYDFYFFKEVLSGKRGSSERFGEEINVNSRSCNNAWIDNSTYKYVHQHAEIVHSHVTEIFPTYHPMNGWGKQVIVSHQALHLSKSHLHNCMVV